MVISHPIPIDMLRRLIRLDPETNKLYWLLRGPEWFEGKHYPADRLAASFNAKFAEQEALTAPSNGYRGGRIFNVFYYAHRVIFALTHGYWPPEVDHRSRVRTENAPGNLRDATHRQNGLNGPAREGTSRFRGVSLFRRDNRWRAYCAGLAGEFIHIGYYDSEVDAAQARDAAAAKLHGDFANLNFPSAKEGGACQA